MIHAVSQYMLSVLHLDKMSRTLSSRYVYPICDDAGMPRCRVGNSVITFEVMDGEIHSALRVYMRPHRNLKAIYGKNYYPNELLVGSLDSSSRLVDVVLCEWHEGETLQTKIEKICCEPQKMAALSRMFEEFAVTLLNKPWAHGDLKPENIIVGKSGLHLIDLDASYHPGFSIDDCVEIGTRQYQHPQLTADVFDKSIDDYPIALIATALAAMSLDKRVGRSLSDSDHLLITPHLAVAGKDEVLDYIEKLFAEVGDVRHYRIARLLRSSCPALPQLKQLLEMNIREVEESDELSVEYSGGYWGYAVRGEFVIPPYYDLAFDFSEGLGLVRIADVWHFIDRTGRVVITCGRGSGIKPFRNGVTRMKRDGGDVVIYRDGRIEKG